MKREISILKLLLYILIAVCLTLLYRNLYTSTSPVTQHNTGNVMITTAAPQTYTPSPDTSSSSITTTHEDNMPSRPIDTKQVENKDTEQSFVDHDIQFFSQAPNGKRDQPFEDACEEASLLLAYNGIRGITMTKEEYTKELLRIIQREKDHFGYYKDTTIQETNQILGSMYNFTSTLIIDNPSLSDIKKQLSLGNLVIAPLYGKGLKNPYFSNQGPEYHYIVIKGYNKDNFITHDVGTSRGANYTYPFDTILSNLHDGDAASIQEGTPRILVIQQ